MTSPNEGGAEPTLIKVQKTLTEVEKGRGLAAWFSSRLLELGGWLEDEWEDQKEAIMGIDNLWLLMSSVMDFNPVCTAKYTFKGKLTREAFEETLDKQATRFPKYKQKLVDLGRRFHAPRFIEDPDFNLERHLRVVSLPGNAGKEELDELVSQFIAEDWDYDRPLWSAILIDNYQDEHGAESAMVTRGHHTLADGQGFVLSQLVNTSYGPEIEKFMNEGEADLRAAKRGLLKPSKINKALKSLDRYAENPRTRPLLIALLFLAYWVVWVFSTLFSIVYSVHNIVHAGVLFPLTFWRMEKVTADYPGQRVEAREFSSSKSLALSDAKKIQKAFSGYVPPEGILDTHTTIGKISRKYSYFGHVTLNDVLCSILADCLAEVIENKPKESGGWETFKRAVGVVLPSPIGIFIPISVRAPGQWDMRNLSTGSIAYLEPAGHPPTDNPSPQLLHKHIHRAKAELSILKRSLLPELIFNVVQILGRYPFIYPFPFAIVPLPFKGYEGLVRDWVTGPLFNTVTTSFTAIVTNVPGPAGKVKFSDAEVLQWTALPPQAGKGTVGIGIITYGGSVYLTVSADRVPKSIGVAKEICKGFEKRFEVYLDVANEILQKAPKGGKEGADGNGHANGEPLGLKEE